MKICSPKSLHVLIHPRDLFFVPSNWNADLHLWYVYSQIQKPSTEQHKFPAVQLWTTLGQILSSELHKCLPYFSTWKILNSPWLLYTWPDTWTVEHPLCCSWFSLFSTISVISTKFSSNPSLSTSGQNSPNNSRRERYPRIICTQHTLRFSSLRQSTAHFPWVQVGRLHEEKLCSLSDKIIRHLF